MYELNQVGEKSYYINCPAKIGIYLAGNTDVYLIDSGNDKEAGKKVRKILDEKGWNLLGILNTHSNADHIGGNQYLQQQTGCKVFSGGMEKAFIEFPVLEPSFLYGGYPCKDLRHKFLLAKSSIAKDFSDEAFPKEVEVIPLKGHFFDMVGFRTPDDTVFLADCLSSRDTLDKYQIGFVYDVAQYLETLEMVKEALEAGADIIMLDNMTPEAMKEAVLLIDGKAEIEISGNVTRENIERIKGLGVDYISSGALTHSAPILDISLKNLRPIS